MLLLLLLLMVVVLDLCADIGQSCSAFATLDVVWHSPLFGIRRYSARLGIRSKLKSTEFAGIRRSQVFGEAQYSVFTLSFKEYGRPSASSRRTQKY